MIVQSWDVFDLPTDALVEQLNLLRIMETKNGGTLGQSHSEIRTLIHQELQDRNYTVGILQRQVVPPPPIPPPPPPPVHGVFPTIQPQPQQQQQQPILQQSSSSWSFEQYSGHPGRVSISKPPRQRNPTTAGEGAFVVKKKSSTASAKPKPVEKKRKPPVPRLSRRHQQPTPSSQQGGTTPALSNTNTTEGGGGNDDSATDSDTASSCNSSSDGYAEEEEVTAAPSPMTDEDPLHVNIARSCNDLLSMVVQPSTRTPRLVVLDPPTLPPQPPGGGGGTTNPNSSTSSSRVTTPRPTPRPVGTPPTQAQANSVVVVGPSVVTTTNTATTTVVNSNNTNNTNSSNGAGGAVVENKTESSHKGVAVSIPLVSPSSATSLREKVLSARLSSGGDTITTDNSSIVDVPQPPTTRRSSVGSVSTTASSSITSSVGPFTPYRKPPTPTSAGAPTTTTSTTGSTTNGIVNFTTPRTHNVAPTPPVLPTANKSFACMSVVKEDQGIISLIQKPTSPPQLQPIISSSTTATPQIAPPQQRRNSLTLSDSGGNISSLLHSSNPSSTSNQGGNRSKSAAGATTNNNNTNTINNNITTTTTTTPSSKTTLSNPSPILRKTISAPSVKSSSNPQQQQPSRTSSVRKPSVTVVSSSSDSDGETEDTTSKVLTPQSSQPAQLDYTQYFSDFTDLFVAVVPPKGQKVDKYLREREILLEIKQLIAEWVKNPNDTRLGDDSDDDGVTAASRRPMLATTRIDPKDLEGVDGAEMTYRVQRSREEVYDLLTFVCRKITHPSTWQETGDCLFNLHWTWSKPKVTQKFYFIAQLVNHIPGSHVLTRKDCLKKQLYKFRRLPGKTGEFFDICPQSFVLPSEFMALTEAMSTAGSDSYWIAKPVGMSRGRGIQLLTEIGQINYTDNIVVQKYLHNPLLLNGKKFDLRLYVVVTQFGPLEAFISTLGFARFAALPFTLDKASLSNKYIHLTNTAIAKEHHNTSIANGVHKWDLHSLQRHLLSQGVKWDDVWGKIKDVVIKTLVCAEDDVQPLPSPKNTFELFGFDVILDSNYRPWVLEVNASPSMDMDNALDHSVKPQLIMDIIELLDPVPFDRVAMLQVVERRFEENMNTNPYRTHGGPTVKAKQAALNKDLHKILRGRVPFRGYGVPPEDMGHFEMIAPSPSYTKISKMKRM